MRRRTTLFCLFLVLLAGMALLPPGGVVVEGQLKRPARSGTSTPFTIQISKGGLEYFGRLLIAMPSDCRLAARQLHGGGLNYDADRNVAVISWLKLPETDSFTLLLDLEVAPGAPPGPRSLEWDFSFIRNNDRETLRPPPFHFEVIDNTATSSNVPDVGATEGIDAPSQNAPHPDAIEVRAERTYHVLASGKTEIRLKLDGLPSGGFVKLTETFPHPCSATVQSGGGSVPDIGSDGISFVWFDYQPTSPIIYSLEDSHLSQSGEIIGTLSYVHDGEATEIRVLDVRRPDSQLAASAPFLPETTGIRYEVQLAANKTQVVTDYFKRRLEFGLPIKEEFDGGWFKYLNGSFERYEDARNHREDLNESFTFIGPFVVSRMGGKRISVQEALTRTGEEWIP